MSVVPATLSEKEILQQKKFHHQMGTMMKKRKSTHQMTVNWTSEMLQCEMEWDGCWCVLLDEEIARDVFHFVFVQDLDETSYSSKYYFEKFGVAVPDSDALCRAYLEGLKYSLRQVSRFVTVCFF